MDAEYRATKELEYKQKFKGIKGKLFGKDKKVATGPDNNNNDVSDFLYGPSDKLHMSTPTPTSPTNTQQLPIVRVDTSSARRWPSAAEINNSGMARSHSANSRRTRKGLVVRFADIKPEVIGVGGDESEEPTAVISQRKRANSHPPGRRSSEQQVPKEHQGIPPPDYGRPPDKLQFPGKSEAFAPGPLRRTQTGFESIPGDSSSRPVLEDVPPIPDAIPADSLHDGFLKSEPDDSSSFAAKVKAEMRAGEGHALTQGASELLNRPSMEEEPGDHSTSGLAPQMQQLHINTLRNSFISTSPNNLPPQLQPGPRPETPKSPAEYSPSDYSPSLSRSSTLTIQAAAVAVGDEALKEFSRRTAHLFTLFRLSTESVKPISVCSSEELARTALWWFLKGRMNLEATVRERPASPEAQQYSFFKRQQAHADLAKSLWITEQVMPQRPELSTQQGAEGIDVSDIVESRKAVLTGLRKLTMSMQRNNFLPPDPDDAPLQQGLDPSIWVRDDGNRSLVSNQKNTFSMKLLDAFPLGDTSQIFSFSRMFVEATLMEEDESQQYRSSCLVSVIRVQNEKRLRVLIASANGTINFCLQGDRAQGPTWDDVAWRTKSNTIDIKLPRGFLLRLQCDQHDFRSLWAIYDYQNTIHASLYQQQNEEVAFEAKVKSFQIFDQSPQSQTFPKEAMSGCQVRIFEKVLAEKAAAGTRKFHRGFRIAVVTGQKVKNLSGINQDLQPTFPVQFGFLRGEGGLPAFLLKIDDGKKKANMVFTFNDVHERATLHARLAGIALVHAESVVAEVRLKEVAISSPSDHARLSSILQPLQWQSIRIINEDEGDIQSNKTVLSDNLRIVMDFKIGTFTDRVNIGTGEMKLRLDVGATNDLRIIRQPQEDMTIALSEAQASKEMPHQLTEVLRTVAKSETIRTYSFLTREELHLFQAALTGFKVTYDGNAMSFNISRRRMVVPIYKKWDAATTRIQVIQREKVVQLVAFFENFSHGDCMNFILKSTDIFETSTKSSKFYLKIVDAKFAMPRAKPLEGEAAGAIDSGYVCLDMPDYPGEHDDITIVFGSEAERDHFTKALPAPAKGASRMGSIKR